MPERDQVIYDIERCICHVPDACRDCSHFGSDDALDCMERLLKDALELLKEQEEKIRQRESMNVSASGNGTAIGVVKGGLVIQKGQNNKHIVNNGTMTMTFGK